MKSSSNYSSDNRQTLPTFRANPLKAPAKKISKTTFESAALKKRPAIGARGPCSRTTRLKMPGLWPGGTMAIRSLESVGISVGVAAINWWKLLIWIGSDHTGKQHFLQPCSKNVMSPLPSNKSNLQQWEAPIQQNGIIESKWTDPYSGAFPFLFLHVAPTAH